MLSIVINTDVASSVDTVFNVQHFSGGRVDAAVEL